MGNMIVARAEHAERAAAAQEEAMLQRAIEESRREAGVGSGPNTDEMTYEQLLALEESNGGSVSRGYTSAQIRTIKSKVWREKKDTKS